MLQYASIRGRASHLEPDSQIPRSLIDWNEMQDYNSRLKPMPQKGLCGDREIVEDDSSLRDKSLALAALISQSKHTVAFTGAGISTSAGIPDFRGPTGVWTRELRGDALKTEEKSADLFNAAQPTFTHQALVSMVEAGHLHHVISQNVDGLHLRSGLHPSKLSELHGNIFMEICSSCSTRYFRAFDVGGMGLKPTGRYCDKVSCRGSLEDFAVDWDTELPKDIFRQAAREIRRADLVICLGTSLRIRPAGNMPLAVVRKNKSRDHAGQLVIVNLQATHLDRSAAVRIHHYTDDVLRLVCDQLGIAVDGAGATELQEGALPSPSSQRKRRRKEA